jgi:hypothetical protein
MKIGLISLPAIQIFQNNSSAIARLSPLVDENENTFKLLWAGFSFLDWTTKYYNISP